VAALGPAEIQAAFDAAISGDLDPLVDLFDPDLDWRGIERGHLWWRHAPA
jgi:ketosteroid isomerase-like protein